MSESALEDLTRFEEWFEQIRKGLSPHERRRIGHKLGQGLRRSNMKRIAANVEPDGTPMEPRKSRRDRRGRLRRRRGRMFKGLRRARNWKIDADADGVEIRPANGAVDRVAAVSHFGEIATVGYFPGGGPIRTRYAVRRVLGFGPEDQNLAIEVAAELFEPKG